MRSVVVGSPVYFNDHGRPKTPTDLTKHRCIRARRASGGIPGGREFEKRGESVAQDVPVVLTLDESL
jgi:hypothetical protein